MPAVLEAVAAWYKGQDESSIHEIPTSQSVPPSAMTITKTSVWVRGQLLLHASQSDAWHMLQLWYEQHSLIHHCCSLPCLVPGCMEFSAVLCKQGAPHIRCIRAQLQSSPVRGLLSLLYTGGRLLSLALCYLHRALGCAGLRLQLLIVPNDCASVQDELLGITLQEQELSGHAACRCARCSDAACWQAT